MLQKLTGDDLRKLPTRAIVALVTRAAMRVRPHTRVEVIDTAIKQATVFAEDTGISSKHGIIPEAVSAARSLGLPVTAAGALELALMTGGFNVEAVPQRAALILGELGDEVTSKVKADYDRLLELELGLDQAWSQPFSV